MSGTRSSCLLQFDIEKGEKSRLKTLSDRCQHGSGNALLFCPHGDLGRDAALAGEGHLDESGHPAAGYGLAEELERVCAVVQGDV